MLFVANFGQSFFKMSRLTRRDLSLERETGFTILVFCNGRYSSLVCKPSNYSPLYSALNRYVLHYSSFCWKTLQFYEDTVFSKTLQLVTEPYLGHYEISMMNLLCKNGYRLKVLTKTSINDV